MEKIRYYYNGKLIRTSDHDYEYAVIKEEGEGKYRAVNCCKNRILAERKFRDVYNYYTRYAGDQYYDENGNLVPGTELLKKYKIVKLERK